MPTKDELQQAIEKLENSETSFEVCQKLATYYYLYDRYYNKIHTGYTSESKFMEVIENVGLDDLIACMDELMDCVAVINPKLYNSVLDKLKMH